MAVAFILGLMIATAGTATAARLITGKQIKDGSISNKDLSKAVQKQLAKTGAAGPQGAVGKDGTPGANGDPGPFPAVLPSGKTLTGTYSVTGVASQQSQVADSPVSFGFRFASAPSVVTVGRTDTAGQAAAAGCPGTPAEPQAAPGKVCIYEMGRANTATLGTAPKEAGGAFARVAGYAPATGPWGTATKTGTIVQVLSAGAGSFYSNGVWAATSQ